MSYTKQTWATGDIVTADKLNHIEDGIAGGGSAPLVCYNDDNLGHLNVTFGAIVEAVDAGQPVVYYSNYHVGDEYRTVKMFNGYEIIPDFGEQDEIRGYSAAVDFGSYFAVDYTETLEVLYAEYPYLAD